MELTPEEQFILGGGRGEADGVETACIGVLK
jgi:hypothetical protein